MNLKSELKSHMVPSLFQRNRLGHQLLSKATTRGGNPGSVSNCPTKVKSEPAVCLPQVKVSFLQPKRCGPCCLTLHLHPKITAVSKSLKQNVSLLHFIRFNHLISVWANFAACRSLRASITHLMAACSRGIILKERLPCPSFLPKGDRDDCIFLLNVGTVFRCSLPRVALYSIVFHDSDLCA